MNVTKIIFSIILASLLITNPFTLLAENPEAAVQPIIAVGDIAKVRQAMVFRRLISKLTNHYRLVSQEDFVKAKEKAIEVLAEQDLCTEQNCIRKIQEYLQVDRLFVLILMKDDPYVQISLTLIREEDKLAEDELCTSCDVKRMIEIVEKLVENLVDKDNETTPEQKVEQMLPVESNVPRLQLPDQVITRPGMVRIAAGEFVMGNQKGVNDEKPPHTVYLDNFQIDINEVTVNQYKKCVDAGKCKKPATGKYFNWGEKWRNKHPVNGVDWNNAVAYCRFVGKRLPSEAEWEKAATWKEGRKYKYPSGKPSISCADAVMDDGNQYGGNYSSGCGKGLTWPVGSKAVEINGTFDMAGNVWEWTKDWYGDYHPGKQSNPKGPKKGLNRVIRGGSWFLTAGDLRGSDRDFAHPSGRNDYLGFRCAVSP